MIDECAYSIIKDGKQKEIFECDVIKGNNSGSSCLSPKRDKHRDIISFVINNRDFQFNRMVFDNSISVEFR